MAATTSVQTVFTIENFDFTKLQWTRWVKRLEGAFTVFKIPEADKLAYLLHYMGAEAFDVLCDKLAPEEPTTKTYAQVVNLMQQHYSPAPLEIAENFRFHQRKQGEGESVQEFLTALQKLAIHCNFGNYQKTALRNQLVFGLRSEKIQNRLLETRDLNLDRALEISVSMELSSRDTAQLHRHSTAGSSAICAVGVQRPRFRKNSGRQDKPCYTGNSRTKKTNQVIKCYRCDKVGHLANKCDKINFTCTFCNIKGHIQPACSKWKQSKSSNTNQLEEVEEIIALVEAEHSEFRGKFRASLQVDGRILDFEIDSGAAVTVIGNAQFNKSFPNSTIRPTKLKLITYCKNKLGVLGYKTVLVTYNNIEYELNIYVIEGNREPLLGREWIRQLQFDLWNTMHEIQLEPKRVNTEIAVQNVINKYASVFTPGIGKIKGVQARLHLKENSKPIFIKARSIPFSLAAKVEAELENLVNLGILEKIDHSEWATPIVPVSKANGKIRICGDFKVTINPYLKVDVHPLPTIDELFAHLAGGQKFTKIDISQAYLHMEIHSEDRKLLTLNTHKGLYQCNRMMFGISSAPAIWQRTMENILKDIPGVSVFLDDIKITGPNDEVHLNRVELVLARLQEHNLVINQKKCKFFEDKIEYCGYLIDKNGIHKLKSKIDAIQNAAIPNDKHQVRAFIGLVNYYGRFFKNLSTILAPLNNLLRDEVKFIWDKECEKSFNFVKKEMQSDTVLAHYDPKLPLVLATDASPYGVGAVLSHVYPDGTERPIQFASQTLTNTQRKYAQIDREAYSIVFGVRKFYQFLYGNRFILYTDHRPLVHIFSPKKGIPVLSATRMQHYAVFLQSFNYDIQYKSSKLHGNADFLSRFPLCSEALTEFDEPDIWEIKQIEKMPVTVSKLAAETEKDKLLAPLLKALQYNQNIPAELRFNIDQSEFAIQQGCIMRGKRVVIPESLQIELLNELHCGHFGIFKMKSLSRSYCWWPGIDNHIEKFIQNCSECNKLKNNPIKVQIHPWEDAEIPFKRVHVDYAGPFHGQYYFILVDAYSRWPEVIITKDMTAQTTVQICREIFSRFGLPMILVSDNGRNFTSSCFESFLKLNGVKHIFTAPYHPATNGLAEKYVQTLKKSLRAMSNGKATNHKELASFLLQYRKMPHSITKISPSMLMFNREIHSRLDLIKPNLEALRKVNSSNLSENEQTRQVEVGKRVSVRDYIHDAKWMFGHIQSKLGKLHYLVRLDDGRIWKRHIDQMREIGENTPQERHPESTPCPLMETATESIHPTIQPDQSMDPKPVSPTKDSTPTDKPETTPIVLRRSSRLRRAPIKLNL